MDEPFLKLAIAVQSSPGVYALLIGSGLSSAARIPTGWEITLDLVRRIAAAKGVTPVPPLDKWYQEEFGENPTYDKLLEQLAPEPAERTLLLRRYFEPSAEEKEQGEKVPTPAHHAAAELVAKGYVRCILTTNFDRLMEQALEDKGVVPDVLSSEEDIKGAVPLLHSKCVLVKVHGDYRSTRLKNTVKELAEYSEATNTYLDRVLDEFGLIVCGWSATWDVALRNAIMRCPNRRFTTFWLQKDSVTEDAERLVKQRRAQVVRIEDANQAFSSIIEKIRSLEELSRPTQVSIEVAVATVKRYLSENKYRIQLSDLLTKETENVRSFLASGVSDMHGFSPALFQARMVQYEVVSERLTRELSTLCYYDGDDHGEQLTEIIVRLANGHRREGNVLLLDLQYYPALLVLYSAGVAAMAARHFQNLAGVLRRPEFSMYKGGKRRHCIQKLNPTGFFYDDGGKLVPRPSASREYTPLSNYLFDRVRLILKDCIVDDTRYEDAFDAFEYLLSLNFLDVVGGGLVVGRYWHRFTERYEGGTGDYPEGSILAEFKRFGLDETTPEALFRAGFFSVASGKEKSCSTRLDEMIKEHNSRLVPIFERWEVGL